MLLLGVGTEDFKFLLGEPNGAKQILENVINCPFLLDLNQNDTIWWAQNTKHHYYSC